MFCSIFFRYGNHIYIGVQAHKKNFHILKFLLSFGGHLVFFYSFVFFLCIALLLIKIFMVFACAMFYP